MEPWFIATQKFSPATDSKGWEDYIAHSGLTQLDEVVSLDSLLCPTLLPDIRDDYWPHIVNENFMSSFFVDADFLLGEVAKFHEMNFLCVFRNPENHPQPPAAVKWDFIGYDLLDVCVGISAITNCGGFPLAFSNSELSSRGLLTNHERALEVQSLLRMNYKNESHADCHVWAIFRAPE